MAVYYVLGSILVVWALVLSALGITRPDFPPSGAAGRALVGVTVAIVLGALVALLATTHVEHPREDAAAEAAVKKAEQKPAKSKPGTAPGKQVKATEKEFSISLASGSNLTAGNYTFAVQNVGKIQHDLAISGSGKEVKTPLLSPGESKDLNASLQPGKYTFFCTVPGHEQAGMKVEVTVK